MVESFSAFPVVELPRRAADTDTRPCLHTQHAARSWTAKFQPAQVAGDAAGIRWYEYESNGERQFPQNGKGRPVYARAEEELGGQPRSESPQRLNHSGAPSPPTQYQCLSPRNSTRTSSRIAQSTRNALQ